MRASANAILVLDVYKRQEHQLGQLVSFAIPPDLHDVVHALIDLCARSVSYTHLTKLKSCFKKYYDCTITEYVQQRRMSQAEYLLAYTELTVEMCIRDRHTLGFDTSMCRATSTERTIPSFF